MAGTGKAHLRDGDNVLRVEDLVVEFKVGSESYDASAIDQVMDYALDR